MVLRLPDLGLGLQVDLLRQFYQEPRTLDSIDHKLAQKQIYPSGN